MLERIIREKVNLGRLGNKWNTYIPELGEYSLGSHLESKCMSKLSMTAREWLDKRLKIAYELDVCPICGKEISESIGSNKCCSVECNKLMISISNTVRQIEYYKNPDNRKKTSDSIKKTYKDNPELHDKISKRTKEGCNKPGQHEKRSEAHRLSWLNPTEAMLNPRNKFGKGYNNCYSGVKSSIISKYTGDTLYFDSNWEKLFYYDCTLDNNIVKLSRWKDPIRYVRPSDGLEHGYFPDYLIGYYNGTKEIIEIKPARLLDDPDTVAKIKAGISYSFLYSYKYRVVTEENYDFDKSRIFSMPI